MEFEYSFEGGLRKVRLEKKEGGYAVRVGDEAFEAGIIVISEHELVLFDGRRAVPAYRAREGERLYVSLGGRTFILSPPAPEVMSRRGDDASYEDGRRVRAPMPGKVIKILVAEGESVRRNQTLAIVEAMKMENEIKSACEGVVRTIRARAGELVGAQMILIELEPKT
jgi:acetyl/propionyl-CoA carboxylase alpha subunit